jgi:hypothetical protein
LDLGESTAALRFQVSLLPEGAWFSIAGRSPWPKVHYWSERHRIHWLPMASALASFNPVASFKE